MNETDPWLGPQAPGQNNRSQLGSPVQNQCGAETSGRPDEVAYWRVATQVTDYFEAQRPQLMVNLGSNLEPILYDFDGGSARLLDDYDRILVTERRKRKARYDHINQTLIGRLGDLGLESDPDRIIEKELWASIWYQQQAKNFIDSAEFHRTRLEMAKLRLITCGDFRVDDFFDTQSAAIIQIAEDECLEAVNWIYAQEMAACHNYCLEAAGEGPESEERRNALQNISCIRLSQARVDPTDMDRATNNHVQFWTTVHQLGELRRVWDQAINPTELYNHWLAQLGDQISSWVTQADDACHRARYQIHLVASIGNTPKSKEGAVSSSPS